MSMWSVSSKDGTRWFHHSGSNWSADGATRELVEAGLGQPVTRGAATEPYAPTSKTDPAGLYLLALDVVPGPHTETGTPPEVPEPESTYPAGTVH